VTVANPPPAPPQPRCIHLYAKSLTVHGEAIENDPAYENRLTDCCCIQTARPLGPDGGTVGLPACRDPDRDCYREY
jgi:hypothetical protein